MHGHPHAILVTGFEPFGSDDRNPSQTIAEGLGGGVLPVAYSSAGQRLGQLIDQHRPFAVLLCGLNASAAGLLLERQAVNEDDAAIADNAGEVRRGRPIDPTGPGTLPATFPLDTIAAALDRTAVRWEWSDSAGRFLCNHVYYTALRRGISCAFLHLPWPCDWEPARSGLLTFAEIEASVRACALAMTG